MATERKLWIDTQGQPVITTIPNGHRNALHWGWTPAVAVAAVAEESIDSNELDFSPDEDALETLQGLAVMTLHQIGYGDDTPKDTDVQAASQNTKDKDQPS